MLKRFRRAPPKHPAGGPPFHSGQQRCRPRDGAWPESPVRHRRPRKTLRYRARSERTPPEATTFQYPLLRKWLPGARAGVMIRAYAKARRSVRRVRKDIAVEGSRGLILIVGEAAFQNR